MRILFSFYGPYEARGHFEPLAPLARAAIAAGHSVAFACEPPMVAMVESAGFTVLHLPVEPAHRRKRGLRGPLLPPDQVRMDAVFVEGFIQGAARRRVAPLAACVAEWRPDVLVCEETDVGAMAAAELHDLPYATVQILAAGSAMRPSLVGEPLAEVRAACGLPPDPDLQMLSRYLVLSPFPVSLRDPTAPLPPTTRLFRPQSDGPAAGSPPAWATALPGAPALYFTLGTLWNLPSGDLFERVIAGLSTLSVNVLVTVGEHIDPAEIGLSPPHIRIERYVPQRQVLPHCAAVIAHGGSGSLLGALAHGLPLVLFAIGADQLLNAARCEALGVARRLDPTTATPESIRTAVTEVLEQPGYRRAAEALRDEIAAMPDVRDAVAHIERLVQP
jgi:UDP:flavonoid glycosyltransferase YjiC (YdhE family)